ncbi:MAG: hypothetical protein HQ517_17220 [SAR324 cluster bacterium]|nr:hypothetical protein [SAR324 cluster bacterium]
MKDDNVGIMFFATIESLLNYDVLAGLISSFLVLTGHVVLGPAGPLMRKHFLWCPASRF